LEDKHVTQVYECIAQHFSNTRHKPWPIVESWLKDLPSGSLVADIGCGNGKYLNLHSHYHIIGLDKSIGLTNISNSRGHEVAVADSLDLPFVNHKFDYCISIAVIHHFSNRSRRIEALKEIKRILAPGGHALIFVWALEQSVSLFFVIYRDPLNLKMFLYHGNSIMILKMFIKDIITCLVLEN
jgi:SAM-dependent methyltransferase